jgi:hypothetical protein
VDSVDKYKFVVEPEIINKVVFDFELTFEEITATAGKLFPEFLKAKKLRPSNHLKLLVNPEIIINEETLTPEEFGILITLTEFSKVIDVYQVSNFLEFEITNALVSLRKKKAILVVNN